MLGDWDLQSTLLRRALQDGALRFPAASEGAEPLLVERAEQLHDFQRRLIAGSREARREWASRFILPPVEDFATHWLMETPLRPSWLMWLALVLTLAGAAAFSRGWLGAGLILLLVSTPLDLIARRLATIRLRPLPTRMASRILLWPAAGIALLALGWWEARQVSGWGAFLAAIAAAAFAEAARLERPVGLPGEAALLSRRNAIFLAIPFAIAGTWTAYLIALFAYAATSFFLAQHGRRIAPELTRS